MKRPTNTGKARIEAKTRGHCAYCGVLVAGNALLSTYDHIEPVVRGGTDALSNLVLACRICNSQKNAYDLEEFRVLSSQIKHKIPHFSIKQLTWLLTEHGVDVVKDTPPHLFWFEGQGIDITIVPEHPEAER